MENNIQKEFKTFMQRDDVFPGAPQVKSIYQYINYDLCHRELIQDRYNTHQVLDLLQNRIEYLLVTTTRQLCNFINNDVDVENIEKYGEALFDLILVTNNKHTDIPVPYLYSGSNLLYSNMLNKRTLMLHGGYIGESIVDSKGKLKDIEIIFENLFLEGMVKAETLFNIYMQGNIYKEKINAIKMISTVGKIADIYTYTLMKLFVEYVCIYLPKINTDVEMDSEYFMKMMTYYNNRCKKVETYYEEYKFKI